MCRCVPEGCTSHNLNLSPLQNWATSFWKKKKNQLYWFGIKLSTRRKKQNMKKQLCLQLKVVYTILQRERKGFQWISMWWTRLLFPQMLIQWDFHSITTISRAYTEWTQKEKKKYPLSNGVWRKMTRWCRGSEEIGWTGWRAKNGNSQSDENNIKWPHFKIHQHIQKRHSTRGACATRCSSCGFLHNVALVKFQQWTRIFGVYKKNKSLQNS